MKFRVAILALLLTSVTVGGCVGPRPCPPGTHPEPYGRRCFLN
ncbi:hypothetical protein [Lichenibacterium dinghuense]|nr:hypothetical protein [Lichenibacterium sp. 6Y81]